MEKAALMPPVYDDTLTYQPDAIRDVRPPVQPLAPDLSVQRPVTQPGPPHWFGDINDGEDLGW